MKVDAFRAMRVLWMLAIVVLFVAGAAVFAKTQIEPRIVRDAHADFAWSRDAFGAPETKKTRAYRWYPLTYPVLERWSFSDDSDLSSYAMKTIVHFGGPLGRHWLDTAIDRNPPAGILIPCNCTVGLGQDDYAAFAKATGLDDAAGRRRAAERAISHLPNETQDDIKFDRQLLSNLGADAVPIVDAWMGSDQKRLQVAAGVLPSDDSLATASPDILATVDRIRKRATAAEQRSFSNEMAAEPTPSPREQRIIDAVDEVNKGDLRSASLLKPLLDGDLRLLPHGVGFPEMIAVAKAFPQSRYTRGCLAYDRLRGGIYFGREDAPELPTGTVDGWRAWLAAYPDHPGADDAAYWLGRTLQRGGRRVEALETYADAIQTRAGDDDMIWSLWNRASYMLDVDMSEDDLIAFDRRYPASRFHAFARYARAVRHARVHDFRGALALARDSGFERAIARVANSGLAFGAKAETLAYRDQLARWRALERLGGNAPSTMARDELASAWNDDDGWKIGYLVLFDGERDGGPILDYGTDLNWKGLARQTQLANQNAQVIDLAEPLTRAGLPEDMRKRNLRRIIFALYRELNAFPDPETKTMGGLAALPGDADWALQLDAGAERYVHLYPQDPFDQTALISAYQFSKDRAFLAQSLAAFPNGDRAEEAKALAWH